MRTTVSLALIVTGFLAGCNEPAPQTPPAKSGVEIKAPGVDIKIDKDKEGGAAVEVKAPGTDVQVDRDEVQVDAPGTKVEIDK